ncbi:MAG: Ig-like domain-containing protein, partial [Gammaproteobacteria bacterium]|nr:Ig-like domain-containing protein [Gammaproteobacteria bacterium]
MLPGQPNNVGSGTDACGWEPGTGLLATEEAAGVLVAPMPGVFGSAAARIDGFSFTTADYSAGVLVNGYVRNLEISNNIVSNNLGQAAAGIRVGHASLFDGNGELVDAQNVGVLIHHNHVHQNGSTFEQGGGIGLYNGSNGYRVQSNYVCGNFAQADGGGIAHYGRSPGGLIQNNRILFNQSFDQTAQGRGGSAGGILVAGHEPAVGAAVTVSGGTGSMKIVGNHIEGNQAGAGDGGGILLRSVNGRDLLASSNPTNWYRVDVVDNMIVNNVAGLAGGGILLQDAVRANVVNNTIANNDSAATAAAALDPANPDVSNPQPAGLVSRTHSLALQALTGPVRANIGDFSNPLVRNNLILSNRSHRWNTPAMEFFGFNDVGLIGMAGRLDLEYNVLSSESPDPTAGGPYGPSNPRISAATSEDALVLAPYFNRGSVGPTGDYAQSLLAASATDEGGNFLSLVHYPLTPTGNYHLESGLTGGSCASRAIDCGTNSVLSGVPAAHADYDGELRPVDGIADSTYVMVADIGADEVQVPVAIAVDPMPPQILSTAPTNATVGRRYEYQVVAADPNATPFTYGVTCDSTPSSRCGSGAGAPQIDANGRLTWTPLQSGPVTMTVNACSPAVMPCTDAVLAGDRASQAFDVNVSNAGAAPTAVADSYAVNTQGTFSVAAPGVLGNDSPDDGSLTAELASNLTEGGSVSLSPNGAFSYVPLPGYVGLPQFTYFASAAGGDGAPVSATVAVTLDRELVATSMEYFAASGGGGEWRLAGRGRINGRTLTFTRDRGGVLIGTATNAVAGNSWSFSTTTGPDWRAGDTVTVVATDASADPFT